MRKERFLLEEKEEDILPEVKTEISLDVDKNELEDISAEEEQSRIDSVNVGLSNVLTALIKDEWEAYEGYKSAIETFKIEGVNTEVINVLDEILAEELVHIGQLQKALELVEPQATEIPEGEKEAEKQLAGEEGHVDEAITEAPDLDGDETDNEIYADADRRRLDWYNKKLKKYGDLMFYFRRYSFLDAMASKPTLEERKKFIIDYINRDLPSYRNSNSKTGERSSWYAGPEYVGKYGEFNGKPIDQELLARFADFVLDYYKEYPDFKRNLKESLKNGKKLKEDININDRDIEDGYSIDVASMVYSTLDYMSDDEYDDDKDREAFFELYNQLDFMDKMKYCNWVSNQVDLGDYTWQCVDEDVQEQVEINLEVLEKITGNDVSNLQPIEVEESAESMLKLRESTSKNYTIDFLDEVDYRLREWLLPGLEEIPESDLSEVESFLLSTTDEVLDEVCKEVAYKVRDDESIWQEIGEAINYYLSHYSIEDLKELENKFVHLEPIEVEEGK